MASTKFSNTALLTVALFPMGAWAEKETFRIELIKGDKPFDTVLVWVDYDVFPEGKHPNGGEWSDFEKDSVWSDPGAEFVRYTHTFLAIKDGRKGSGFDYIHYQSSNSGLPMYSANCGFTFLHGDSSESFNWDPAHFQDNADVEAGLSEGLGNGVYGSYQVLVNGVDAAHQTWALVIGRAPGWEGENLKPVSLAPVGKNSRARAEGHAHTKHGFFLPASSQGQAMRMYDVQGRLLWEMRE